MLPKVSAQRVAYYGDKGTLKLSIWVLRFHSQRQGRRVAREGEGRISSACCILANLSMELGRGLRWDAQAEKVIGDDEANRRLARAYRSPWTHPTPETV